jgi:hypothetical protein
VMPERESGQSLIETVLLSLLFLVPLIWALTVLSELHRGALATTAAAREAGFEAARSQNLRKAEEAVERSVAQAFSDHGLVPSEADVAFSAAGFGRGATVEIKVTYAVPVAQAPLLGRLSDPHIEVGASHVAIVDPYRSRDAR